MVSSENCVLWYQAGKKHVNMVKMRAAVLVCGKFMKSHYFLGEEEI
jgi:hypothetical protein